MSIDVQSSPTTTPPRSWTSTRRHQPAVANRLLGEAPFPASAVTIHVATRPLGGQHRATGRLVEGPARTCGGKRASEATAESILLNATDAANHLALGSPFWDATVILSHREIARMALDDARWELDDEAAALPRFMRGRKALLADIDRRRVSLDRALALLDEAHRRNLVKGD